jgi:hypothetical protein
MSGPGGSLCRQCPCESSTRRAALLKQHHVRRDAAGDQGKASQGLGLLNWAGSVVPQGALVKGKLHT